MLASGESPAAYFWLATVSERLAMSKWTNTQARGLEELLRNRVHFSAEHLLRPSSAASHRLRPQRSHLFRPRPHLRARRGGGGAAARAVPSSSVPWGEPVSGANYRLDSFILQASLSR